MTPKQSRSARQRTCNGTRDQQCKPVDRPVKTKTAGITFGQPHQCLGVGWLSIAEVVLSLYDSVA